MSILYDIKNLTKKVRLKNEVKSLLSLDELQLEKGKIHLVKGQNGAGKTTLLHILALVSAPTSGIINFCGENVDFSSESQLCRLRKEVVLIEQLPIMFTGSVEYNVCYGLAMRKIDKKTQIKKMDEVLELLNISHLKGLKANNLSGGETQRLAIARALILQPQCLIFDEATSQVDKESKSLIENIIKNLVPKTTIIMTSHNEEQSKFLSDKSITLSEGRLI